MQYLTPLLLCVSIVAVADEADYAAARAELADNLQIYARLVGDMDSAGFSDAVMTSMHTVKRHALVLTSQQPFAYENRPLPIGHGQAISQPAIVRAMTEPVGPHPDDGCPEWGTG